VPRFSANLHFLFAELPQFLDRFAAAARAGFRAVEFPHPYLHPAAELRRRLDDNQLECVLINFPMGDTARGEKGTAGLPDRVGEFRASVAQAIDMARALGCPRANCMAGIAPPGADPERLRATLIDNLGFAARAFAAAGLTVTLEALNPRDVPGYLVGTVQAAADVIAAVGADNLRFQFDLYHLYLAEGDRLLSRLDESVPLIEHVQIADAPGRHEPGTGEVPWQAALTLLDGRGYAGWVGAEYHPSPGRRTEDTLGWMR
jgi:hydroxypyruvate isomerase